ncbi:MAG: pyruvate kinase [Gracilibacteraceae bacterium]|jgi:pyruvate kinase|nr:pyruvate kinase [Gracilibacteraceae bacterium]
MRRTKIICTMGPASDSPEIVGKMIEAGMNIARLNFSHGSHEEHAKRIHTLRMEALKADCDLGILLDTKGPEIRTGLMTDDGVDLAAGQEFTLDLTDEIGSVSRVSVTYVDLWRDVKEGDSILLDDGLIELVVLSARDGEILTEVLNGGRLKSRKGVNVPNVAIQLPALTEKDRADIIFGIEQQVDFIAASFTRKAADILEVRTVVEQRGANIKIIAKIENREGIANIDQIIEVSDGVMVARGDLGVEIPVEEVPIFQKEIIRKCNDAGKPVVVATQMLDSMMRNPRPTRAETSDVANAIIDGTDAIMLSGETAAGMYPLKSLETMAKIACRTEEIMFQKETPRVSYHPNVAEAIGHASNTIARDLNASAIITPTQSGITARMISKFRSKAPVVAATPLAATARSLSINWGVFTVLIPEIHETDELLSVSVNEALAKKYVKTGDVVVLTAGVPVGRVGATNLIKVQVVGNVLGRGLGIGRERYTGAVNTSLDPDEFQAGDILVVPYTDMEHISVMSKAGAVVVETGGLTSHAAIAALQFGIPTIVGVQDAVLNMKNGATLTVDALTGVVYEGAVMMI